MEIDLNPRTANQTLFEGEGGGYYLWSSKEFPLLAQTKLGAGKLVLKPNGFALPHYADSSKVGYVLQGSDGVVGMVFPKKRSSKEVVLKLKKGDIIPVPLGALSWWYNNGDSELVIVFLGQTTKAYVPGEFTYFLLTGGLGILGAFSTEYTSKAFDMSKDEAKELVQSQSGVLIIKLEAGKKMPKPQLLKTKELVFNINDYSSLADDENVKRGGIVTTVNKSKFSFIGEVGLTATHLKLEPHSMSSPIYTTDSSVRVIYVVKGSGRIQIVGIQGKRVLDTEVKAGQLVVVPAFFVEAKIAGEEGMECFSIINSAEPILEDIASDESVLAALSPEVLQASLNISAVSGKHFISEIMKNSIILPPTN
ncbi:glutelin type-D 1 [Ziziphus jujuba]|uniref:Glutelin type-D 1 n=1 Tax=Ziziphus jujuba TaxID=326968 RepID=A0A6P4AWS2_ZIZJJ|nr:glutelin type-D 1 [Ziziphus jujuba]